MTGLEAFDFIAESSHARLWCPSDLSSIGATEGSTSDQTLDEWEDKLVKLGTEYDQELTAKMDVVVLYGMVLTDLQDKVLDECAVNWDDTKGSEAGRLYTKIKGTLRNIAKAKRAMAGPKPMEMDRVADWREWPDDLHCEHSNQSETEEGLMMRRAATRCTCNTSERAVRRAGKVSKDIATSVVDSDTRSGIARQGRWVWQRLWQGWKRRQRVRQRKGRRWQGRHAGGLFWVWVYGMSSKIARRTQMSSKWRRTSQRFSSSVMFRTKKRWRDGEKDAHEGHSWRLRKEHSQGADPRRVVLVGRAWQRTGSRCLRSTRRMRRRSWMSDMWKAVSALTV